MSRQSRRQLAELPRGTTDPAKIRAIVEAARGDRPKYLVIEWMEHPTCHIFTADINLRYPYKTLRNARTGSLNRTSYTDEKWLDHLSHRLVLRFDPMLLPVVLDEPVDVPDDDRPGGELAFAERQMLLWTQRVEELQAQARTQAIG